MGNIVEGGGINTGYTRSTVSNSPAIGAGSVARNMVGINAYDNRTQSYYSGGDMFVGANGMGAGGDLQDLLLLSLLSQAGDNKCKTKKKKCHDHKHGGKLEDFARKTYEKQPPHSGVGEVLNQMRSNKDFLNDMRNATTGGFLGFGKKLDEAKVKSIATHHFGKDYDSGQIQRAADILVENYSHKHDNASKWAWGLGVPLAIAGAIALPWAAGAVAATNAAAGAATAFGAMGTAGTVAAATSSTAAIAGNAALGALGAGSLGALIGHSVDEGGDGALSREDIDGMANDFGTEHLNRDEAVNYYKNIHYGKKHDAYKHKKHRHGSDCNSCSK